MPANCIETVITGSDGMVMFKPAGTEHCLADFTAFPAGSEVTVPIRHDFWPGDPVVFEEQGGTLDSGLTVGTTYRVGVVTPTSIELLSDTLLTPVTLAGDGGTGTADTPGGHVKISFADFAAVCQVRSFNISLTRARVETTSLRCKVSGGATKYANFRSYQAGSADGQGAMQVMFSRAAESLSRRLLANSLLASQAGARTKLYLDAVGDGTSDLPVDDESLYIEAPISLEGMELSVDSTSDEATIASVNFSISGLPTHLLGIDL